MSESLRDKRKRLGLDTYSNSIDTSIGKESLSAKRKRLGLDQPLTIEKEPYSDFTPAKKNSGEFNDELMSNAKPKYDFTQAPVQTKSVVPTITPSQVPKPTPQARPKQAVPVDNSPIIESSQSYYDRLPWYKKLFTKDPVTTQEAQTEFERGKKSVDFEKKTQITPINYVTDTIFGSTIDFTKQGVRGLVNTIYRSPGMKRLGIGEDKNLWDKSDYEKGIEARQQEIYNQKGTAGKVTESVLKGVGTSIPALVGGLPAMGVLASGGSSQQALDEGANATQAALYGTVVGTIEAQLERLGINPTNFMQKGVAKNILGTLTKSKISNLTKAGVAKEFISDMLQEGAEELLASPLTGLAEKFTYNPNKPLYGDGGAIDPKSALYDGFIGALAGGIIGSAQLPSRIKESKEEVRNIYDNITNDLNVAMNMPQKSKSYAVMQNIIENGIENVTINDYQNLIGTIRQELPLVQNYVRYSLANSNYTGTYKPKVETQPINSPQAITPTAPIDSEITLPQRQNTQTIESGAPILPPNTIEPNVPQNFGKDINVGTKNSTGDDVSNSIKDMYRKNGWNDEGIITNNSEIMNRLINRTHSSEDLQLVYPDNKISRRIFESVTGKRLPKTLRDTKAFFNDKTFQEPKEYQIYNRFKNSMEKVKGTPIKLKNSEDMELFIHQDKKTKKFILTEVSSTVAITTGATREEAIKTAEKIFDERGVDYIKQRAEEAKKWMLDKLAESKSNKLEPQVQQDNVTNVTNNVTKDDSTSPVKQNENVDTKPKSIPNGLSYDEYQKMIDDYEDTLSEKYGESEVLNANWDLPTETKISKDELDYLKELYGKRDSVEESEINTIVQRILDSVDFKAVGKEWIASKESVEKTLRSLMDSNKRDIIFDRKNNTSLQELAKKLYNNLIKTTDAPQELWGEFEYALQLANNFKGSPFGKSTLPLMNQINQIIKGITGTTENVVDIKKQLEPQQEPKQPDKIDELVDTVKQLVDTIKGNNGTIKERGGGSNDGLDEEVQGSNGGTKTRPTKKTDSDRGTEGVSGTKRGERNEGTRSDVGNSQGEPTRRPEGDELGREGVADNGDSEGVRNERINDISEPITQNYRIKADDVLAEGGKKTRFKNNIKAIKLVKKLEAEGRIATPEEQKVLIKFVGWGGVKEAIANKWDKETQSYIPEHEDWKNEYYELKEVLTDEEYKYARQSILNAHFTSPELISAMYDIARHLGFRGGRILEPSVGIGNFIGMLPNDMYNKSSFLAVELDKITGMIAKNLYPDSKIMISGFQNVNIPDNFIDMAISNVPFADTRISDDTHSYLIHNYFFAKTIDKVKEGGLVIYISSTGTMDTSEDKFKKYIDNKADLIGAFRLPNNTFKKNAGTEVTTDIIILRKRSLGEVRKGQRWFERVKTNVKISDDKFGEVNEYFINNPKNVLGKYVVDGKYSRIGVEANGDTMQQLQDRIKTLPENIFSANNSNIKDLTEIEQANHTKSNRKNNSYIKKGGKLYKVVDGKEVEVNINEIKDGKNNNQKKLEKINALIELKETATELLSLQQTSSDADIAELQNKLNKLYDAFVKKFGYVANSVKVIKDDPDSYILNNLEMIAKKEDGDESTDKKYEKADIFRNRVSSPYTRATTASSAQEALAVVLYEDGTIDIDRIASLLNVSSDKAIESLGNLVFENPNGGFETASEYLSGDVRDKLNKAREASNVDIKYTKNVEALEKALPPLKPFNEIKVTLGATWIPADVFDKFFIEVFKSRLSVQYEPNRGKWEVQSRGFSYSQEMRIFSEGTGKDTGWLLTKALNNDTIEISYKKEVNIEATMKAKAKVRELERKFTDYINENTEVQNTLTEHFNALLNRVVERKFSKELKKYIGMSDAIKLKPHQIEGVERIVYGGNTLLAHDVGFGKTFIMITGAMELKRVGIAKKPMMIVPKNKLSDFKNDFAKTYPNAKLLIADEEDFTPHNLKNLLTKIALNNWDCVIISNSSLPLIPIGNDVIEQHINEQLEEARLVLTLAKQSGDKDYSTGDIETHITNLENRLNELRRMPRYDGVTFEQLGVDYLFVDEAHKYKNLAFPTTKTRIKGINKGGGPTTEDFYMKSKYITGLHGGKKGLVFATGTPVSNALNELYTMFKYLRPDILRNIGASSFDSWISMFGSIESKPEVGTGGIFKMTERFSGFHNLQELFRLFKEFADMKYDAQELGLKLPTLNGGKPEIVEIQVSKVYKDYINDVILERIANVPTKPEKGDDTHLSIATDAAKATLDMRMVDANAKDDKLSKLNTAIDNIYKLYKESAKQKGSQLVFIDKGESKPTGFSAHVEVRNKLIKLGIPANEIALAAKYNTDAQKEKLFADVNAGRIRVLIGTYDKMSTGINVQERLFAIHEVNTPWRPSDILQAEGRMIRQGNLYQKWDIPVKILRYVVTDVSSYDAVKWQTIETKIKAINRLMKGELDEIEAEDDENGSAVKDIMIIKAKALGDERLIRQIELNKELPLLQADRDAYTRKIAIIKDSLTLLPDKIKMYKESLKKSEEDYEKAKSYGSDINVVVGSETFLIKEDVEIPKEKDKKSKNDKKVETPKEKAGKAIRKALEKAYFTGNSNLVTINGIKHTADQSSVYIRSNYGSKRIDDLKSDTGVVDRLSDGLLRDINWRIRNHKKEIEQLEKDLENAKKQDISKPFDKESDFQDMLSEKTTIDYEIENRVPLEQSNTKYRKEQTALESIESELGDAVNEAVGDLAYEVAGKAVKKIGTDTTGAINFGAANQSKTKSTYSGFQDAESEQRWKDAKKIATPGVFEKLNEMRQELVLSFSRGAFKYLERGGKYAELRNKLLIFAKGKDIALYRTVVMLKGITAKMNTTDYELFNRKVVLDDLFEDSESDRALPYGFTKSTLEIELSRINSEIKGNEVIAEAISKRNRLWDALKKEYIGAMKSIGFNVDNRFEKKNYFRHLVIEYAEKERILTGTGKKLKTPTNAKYLKKRLGTEKDILSDYLQAESEVMAQMLYDVERAKLIKHVDKSEHNIISELRVEANKKNKAMVNAIIEAEQAESAKNGLFNKKLEPVSETKDDIQKFNKNIAIGFSYLQSLAEDELLWTGKNGEYSSLVESLADDDGVQLENSTNILFKYLSELADRNGEGAREAATILKYTSKRREYIKNLLGDKYATWEKLIPDGYDTWQPREGNTLYMTYSLPEKLAEKLVNGMIESLNISKEQLKQVLIQGAPYKEMVLPVEVVETLDNLSKQKDEGFGAWFTNSIGAWKKWQLISPRRLIKYNLRNITGDADHMFLGNPSAFKKVPRAVKELYDVMYGGKAMTQDMKDFFERGGFSTFLQVQEMGDINELKMFLNTMQRKGDITKLPIRVVQGYWKQARLATDFREAILRYAAYLDYIQELDDNNGKIRNYGGSLKSEVDAIADNRDKASKLSNELLGAYDDVSEAGQYIRKRIIPFWSFTETNMRFYVRAYKNALSNHGAMAFIGRASVVGGKRLSFWTAVNLGRFIFGAFALTALLEIFNRLFFSDEEEALPESVKNRAHIIFGRDPDGNILYFSRLGALSEFLEWFGLGQPMADIKAVLNGKKTWGEQLKSMAIAPINKLWGSAIPFEKMALETATGKKTYPDVTKPGTIRDRGLYLAQSFGLENEYNAAFGKPSKGYLRSWVDSAIYRVDPNEAAYFYMLDTKRRFLEKEGKGSDGTIITPKGNALYNYKLALKYKDKEAADKYLNEYKMLGGTRKGMNQSLNAMKLSFGIPKDLRQKFLESLNSEDKIKFKLAVEYYDSVLKTQDEFEED